MDSRLSCSQLRLKRSGLLLMSVYRGLSAIYFIIVGIQVADGKFLRTPNNTTASVGESVTLSCASDSNVTDWEFKPVGGQIFKFVALGCLTVSTYSHRMEVVCVNSSHSNLVIISAQPEHAGMYKCIENGNEALAKLMVKENLEAQINSTGNFSSLNDTKARLFHDGSAFFSSSAIASTVLVLAIVFLGTSTFIYCWKKFHREKEKPIRNEGELHMLNAPQQA